MNGLVIRPVHDLRSRKCRWGEVFDGRKEGEGNSREERDRRWDSGGEGIAGAVSLDDSCDICEEKEH